MDVVKKEVKSYEKPVVISAPSGSFLYETKSLVEAEKIQKGLGLYAHIKNNHLGKVDRYIFIVKNDIKDELEILVSPTPNEPLHRGPGRPPKDK